MAVRRWSWPTMLAVAATVAVVLGDEDASGGLLGVGPSSSRGAWETRRAPVDWDREARQDMDKKMRTWWCKQRPASILCAGRTVQQVGLDSHRKTSASLEKPAPKSVRAVQWFLSCHTKWQGTCSLKLDCYQLRIRS